MIEIVDYRPEWPDEFQQIASNIRQAMGDLALRIDHIGSTSVPGLSAKDIIDIQITVEALDDRVTSALASIGYSRTRRLSWDHRPPGFNGPDAELTKLFFDPPEGQRATNTHVRVQGYVNQRYALLFRDFLRSHINYAEAYAELKRQLSRVVSESQTYVDVKDPAVDLIYFAAEDWARATRWSPRQSDA